MHYFISVSKNKRLHRVSLFAALLAWLVALVDIVTPAIYWLFDYPVILNQYLTRYAEQMPGLLYPNHQVSTLTIILVFILEMITTGLAAIAMILTGLFFMRFSKGEILSESNIKILWIVGILFVIDPLLTPVVDTLKGLAFAINIPAGERTVQFHINFSTKEINEILQGVFLCVFSFLIKEVKALNAKHVR